MTRKACRKVPVIPTVRRRMVRWLVVVLVLSPLTLAYRCGGGDQQTSTSISGRVTTTGGEGVAGVLMHIFAALPDSTPGCGDVRTGLTDANGSYEISETGSDHSTVVVTITPGIDGYRFDPPERTATISYGEHLTGYDFVATQLHTISGRITTSDGTGVPSVTVHLLDGDSVFATATTDESASYVFFDVPAGTYSILPSGFVFLPVSRTVAVVDGTPQSGPTGQDFVLVDPSPPGG